MPRSKSPPFQPIVPPSVRKQLLALDKKNRKGQKTVRVTMTRAVGSYRSLDSRYMDCFRAIDRIRKLSAKHGTTPLCRVWLADAINHLSSLK